MCTRRRDVTCLEHVQNTRRRTRRETILLADQELTDVDRMKPVDVFVGTNATDHRFRVHVLRQWHLHENAVDAIVGVESVDDLEKLLLADRRRTSNRLAVHPELVAGTLFRAD